MIYRGDMVATTDGIMNLELAQLEDDALLDRVRRRMLLPGAASSHEEFSSFLQQCRDISDSMLSRAEACLHDWLCVCALTIHCATGW